MFSPNDPLIQQNLPRIEEVLRNPSVEIFILPTSKLREMILKNEHPIIQKIGQGTKKIFLEGKGLLYKKKVIFDWLCGKADENHSFVLPMCEIRVRDNGDVLIGPKGSDILKI